MLTKKKKKILTAIAASVAAVAVVIGVAGTGTAVSSDGVTRLYGVQQVVNEMAVTDFNILEIVPDHSYASFGYMVKGSEPVIDGKLMPVSIDQNLETRKAAVKSYLDSISSLVTYDSSNYYEEQLYKPQDTTNWGVLDYSGVYKVDTNTSTSEVTRYKEASELRTGKYVLATEVGLDENEGDYFYSPKVEFETVVDSFAETQVSTPAEDPSQPDVESTVCIVNAHFTLNNNWSDSYENVTVSITCDNPKITITGIEAEGQTWGENGGVTTVSLSEIEAVEENKPITISFTVTVPQAEITYETASIYASITLGYYDYANVNKYSTYVSDIISVNDIGEASVTENTSVIDYDDFLIHDGAGQYVWVDCSAEDGGQTMYVRLNKIYYRSICTSKGAFASKVLELSDSASDADIASRIHVLTYTPQELESALLNNELQLGNMNMVFISNNPIFTASKSLDIVDYGEIEEAGLTEEENIYNDISEETASNIYSLVVNTNLPVIADYSVFKADLDSADSHICDLVRSLMNYAGMLLDSEFISGDTYKMVSGTYGTIADCIYIRNDVDSNVGAIVPTLLEGGIFNYSSGNSSATGEDKVTGMSEITDEIRTDNFYNNSNGDAYTTEFSVDGSGNELIAVTEKTLIKYILNYDGRRVVLYKDSIKVLDIEPTKYSTLTENDVRGWLGISKSSYSFNADRKSIGSTLTLNASTLTETTANITSSKSSADGTHAWTSSDESVATIAYSGMTARIRVVGEGTVTISHEYCSSEGYWFGPLIHIDSDYVTETITITIKQVSEDDSKIKQIDIVQMSTNELNGKLENLIENYDLIYIGSCIGPAGYAGSLNQSNGNTVYNDTSLNNKIYLHVGDSVTVRSYEGALSSLIDSGSQDFSGLMTTDYEYKWASTDGEIFDKYYRYYYTRYSGNDITEDKYDDLLEYTDAGYPIVVSETFYNTDGSINTTYIDTTSYVYKLLSEVASGYTRTESITEEVYEQHKNEDGYNMNDSRVYYEKTTRSYQTVVPDQDAYAELKKVDSITSGRNYVIVSYYNSKNKVRAIKNDLTYNVDLTNTLDGSIVAKKSYATITDKTLLDMLPSIEWTITTSGNGYTYKNNLNQYLYLYANKTDRRKALLNTATEIKTDIYYDDTCCIYVENQNSRSIYAPGYLAAKNSLEVDNSRSYWYLYEVTHVAATTKTVTKTDDPVTKTVEADYYNSNKANDGKTVTSGTESVLYNYYYTGQVDYTYTYSKTASPNVLKANSSGSVIPSLVKYINMPRLNMVILTQPEEYVSTTNSSDGTLTNGQFLVQTNGKNILNYELEFSNSAESGVDDSKYTIKLYVDVNADGQFKESEMLDGLDIRESLTGKSVDADNLSSGVRYTVSREVPEGFVGLLPWKLVISLNNATGSDTVRSSAIGYTAVKNTDGETVTVKVLQIMPDSSSLNLSTNKTFTTLESNVESKLNYDIQITAITVDQLDSYYKKTYSSDSAQLFTYLNGFDMLILGYKDAFGGEDLQEGEIEAIQMFIDSGKSTMFSHDLTSYNNKTEGESSYNINRHLRSVAGMDRYGMTDDNLTELKSKTETYTIDDTLKNRITDLNYDLGMVTDSTTKAYGFLQGFTDSFINMQNMLDKVDQQYATAMSETATSRSMGGYYFVDIQETYMFKTSTISQVNEGQITMYPFNIVADTTVSTSDDPTRTVRTPVTGSTDYYKEEANTVNIANTHYQYYQLDLNYDQDNDGRNDLVVWYTLCSDDTSQYGNVINDVRNNYYIYTVGNITYTGMGHYGADSSSSDVTIKEAQLFMNTIIASYNTGTKDSSVNITQDDSKSKVIDSIYVTYDDGEALDASDESFGFYVSDYNIIQGTKELKVWYYYEIAQSQYNESSDFMTVDDDGNTVYLRAYTTSEISSVITNESAYTNIENGKLTKADVSGTWIQNQLSAIDSDGHGAEAYENTDGTKVYLNPNRIWVGSQTVLTHKDSNGNVISTETTNVSFNYITIRMRTLIDLD